MFVITNDVKTTCTMIINVAHDLKAFVVQHIPDREWWRFRIVPLSTEGNNCVIAILHDGKIVPPHPYLTGRRTSIIRTTGRPPGTLRYYRYMNKMELLQWALRVGDHIGQDTALFPYYQGAIENYCNHIVQTVARGLPGLPHYYPSQQ